MATRSDIYQACKDQGLGTMGDIFDIVLDRGEVTEDQVIALLDHWSVGTLYETWIAPGIDGIEDLVQKGAR